MIDSPQDLASLALTSRDWASTIIPDYLYRELNIRVNYSAIWKALAERPHLAKCTHTLRLLDPSRNKSAAPYECFGPTTDTLRNMSLALEGFTSLRKFCWAGSRNALQINQTFLEALARCPALEELDLGPVSLQSDHRIPSISSVSIFHMMKTSGSHPLRPIAMEVPSSYQTHIERRLGSVWRRFLLSFIDKQLAKSGGRFSVRNLNDYEG